MAERNSDLKRRARGERAAPIRRLPARVRAQIVRRVCESLEHQYGRPRFGNPRNPLDDLVYIILSNKTDPASARRAYRDLRDRFPSWENLLRSPSVCMRRLLRPAGLATVKTAQIRAALRDILKDFGALSLRSLRGLTTPDAEVYLVSLPGVSHKVAKCVLMYTMDRQVLPVDVHVHRVSKRLGWTAKRRADQCHEELESLVLPKWRFVFHVGCVAHSRSCCRPAHPRCDHCCIRRQCCFYLRRNAQSLDIGHRGRGARGRGPRHAANT